jgi:hypothetical protein
MEPVKDVDRIRKGLRFLAKADKAVIRSAVILELLEGVSNPPGIADLLKRFTFHIGRKSFSGLMTEEQAGYLKGYTGDFRKFADAIASTLLKMNKKIPEALTDLSDALDPSKAKLKARLAGGISPPPCGCCTYDTGQQQNGVTQSFCEGGLVGNWDPNPCIRPGKS